MPTPVANHAAKPVLRLSTLIREETDTGITLHRLAQLINEENQEAGTNCRIDHRMLAKIRDDPQKMGLTMEMLVALDTYFRKRGKGLQQLPILETRGVLEALVDSAHLNFMLGAKPRPEEQQTDISRWDTRSLAELLTKVSQLDIHRKFDIEDVLWRSPVDTEAIKSERWHQLLDNPRSPDPNDSRAKRAVATPEGIALVEEVRAVGRVVYEHAMRGISASERKQLLDMLGRMKENVLAMSADQRELVE
jgi:hypothetical protein